jgi:hypothetical protein
MNNLLNNVMVTTVLGEVAAGQAANASSILDMSGYQGVMFIAKLSDSVANGGVATLKVQQNTANSTSGMADLTGTVTHTDDDDADDDLLILDVVNPNERYVRAVLTTATADIGISGIVAIQYGALDVPITQGTTVLDSDTLGNPAES